VFFTTHYLEEAEAADAVCVLAQGRIIERGSPAEIKARQASTSLEDAYLLLLERSGPSGASPGPSGAGPSGMSPSGASPCGIS
jgi:ABC-type Na+ transport system ATPase subunit NatA